MTPARALRAILSLAAFVAVALLAFLPILFALAGTRLHDGGDVPGAGLVAASAVGAVAAGALAAWGVHRLVYRLSAKGSSNRPPAVDGA